MSRYVEYFTVCFALRRISWHKQGDYSLIPRVEARFTYIINTQDVSISKLSHIIYIEQGIAIVLRRKITTFSRGDTIVFLTPESSFCFDGRRSGNIYKTGKKEKARERGREGGKETAACIRRHTGPHTLNGWSTMNSLYMPETLKYTEIYETIFIQRRFSSLK